MTAPISLRRLVPFTGDHAPATGSAPTTSTVLGDLIEPSGPAEIADEAGTDGTDPHARARRFATAALTWMPAVLVPALAVLSWFDPGHFVAAGDIGPFHRVGSAADAGRLWGYSLTGAGSPTVEAARRISHLSIDAGTAVGISAVGAQMLFFWGWLSGAALAVTALVRQLLPSRTAAVVAGVLTVANPLMAANLPNVLVPAMVLTVAGLAVCWLRAARGRHAVWVTVAVSLPVSYLGVNPPSLAVTTLAVAAAITAVAASSGPAGRRRLLRHLAVATPLALAIHLQWLVPAVHTYLLGGAELVGETDPQIWSWTQVNSSLANVVTLTAHWGWGLHEYLPFSRGLDGTWLSPARWALPLMAVAAPFLARNRSVRRAMLILLGGVVALVAVAKGLHSPFSDANLWAYSNIPGMWLLREPMSKVGPLLLLGLVLAAAVTVDAVSLRRSRSLKALVGVAVVAAVAFGHPVLTGGVAPTDRAPLPSSRVAVPDGWLAAAEAVNADPALGKALVLPSLPFYQATTDWGFHGVATLPRDLLARPVLLNLPGGYFEDPRVVTDLVEVVGHAGSPAAVDRALDALGVSHVLVRTDLSNAQAVRPVDDGREIAERLTATGLFDGAVDHGPVTVLSRSAPTPGVSAYAAGAHQGEGDGDSGAHAITALPEGVALIDSSSAAAVSVHLLSDDRLVETTVATSGPTPFEVRASGSAVLSTKVDPTGITLHHTLGLEIDGKRVEALPPIVVPAVAGLAPTAISIDGDLVEVRDGGTVVVPSGASAAAMSIAGTRALKDFAPVEDCLNIDESPARLSMQNGPPLRLGAARHAACTWVPLGVAGPARVSFEHRTIAGGDDAARWCLLDEVAGTCTRAGRLDGDGTWQATTIDVDASPSLRLYLYADAGDDPADVAYRSLRVARYRTGPATALTDLVLHGRSELEAGAHTLRAVNAPARNHLGDRLPQGNCNDLGQGTDLRAEPIDGGVALFADGDAACVSYEVSDLRPGQRYVVAFDHRTVAGRPARWCLWVTGSERCANHDQALARTSRWTSHEAEVTIPTDSIEARLFFYADGLDDPVTHTEYRGAAVRPARRHTLVLGDPPELEPTVVVHDARPERHRFTLDLGTSPSAIVALDDHADDGWTLEGLPAGATATPAVVDGFRQGWVIAGLDAETELVARYGPGRSAELARQVSALAALVMAALALRSGLSRLRRRRAA